MSSLRLHTPQWPWHELTADINRSEQVTNFVADSKIIYETERCFGEGVLPCSSDSIAFPSGTSETEDRIHRNTECSGRRLI
jgi:hypothetical protein